MAVVVIVAIFVVALMGKRCGLFWALQGAQVVMMVTVEILTIILHFMIVIVVMRGGVGARIAAIRQDEVEVHCALRFGVLAKGWGGGGKQLKGGGFGREHRQMLCSLC